ncbi:MAG: hypothetical protein H6970_07520 [Gammaproteobacteria bacterium]|nr:hypothetical protein [Gammaproteobacteria bacterium]MCP5458121.1 hypothetical protein [Gammaproteobacteria bacterium]
MLRLFGLALFWAVSHLAYADTPPLPQSSTESHLGVVTCAGSTCHGATRPFKNSPVLQNEFVTWHREDKHAQAYKVLLNDRSKRIARNLGLESAQTAKICLDCHTDNVPPAQRGERFQLSDGVGCEACHGGAQHWLGPHVSGQNSHADNIKAGLYPTEDPQARASLCLSCHLGNNDKFTTHRIMGAGHPRLSFELDTFTDIEPAHYQADDDYRKRKTAAPGSQVWAIGQAVAADRLLSLYLDPKYHSQGLFPELSFFDCFACHHSFNQMNWSPRQSTGLGPGTVRFNDANLLMLKHVAQRFSAADATRLAQATLNLHQATEKGEAATQQAARQLREQIAGLRDKLAKEPFDAAAARTALRNIAAEGARGEYSDYAAAEQSVMALASLVNSLKISGGISADQATSLNASLDGLYDALADQNNYQPARYITASKAFQAKLPGN